MKIQETTLAGVYVIDIEKTEDNRGFFARTWDPAIAKANGLIETFEYSCASGNTAAFTLRGMHYQPLPHGEVKLVRCTKGKLFDVALDLRKDSKTFKQWFGSELSEGNHRGLYIPAGFAHGFITLEANTEILYMISGEFKGNNATGARWNDPAFGIHWPVEPKVIAERDAHYQDFV